MRAALAIAATIAVPIRAAADEPTPAPTTPAPTTPAPTTPAPTTPSEGPTFAPGGVPIPPAGTTSGTTTSDAASSSTTTPDIATTTNTSGEPTTAEPGADPAYGRPPDPDVRKYSAPRAKDVVIIAYPERSRQNIMLLAGLGTGGVLLGAIGLYFHLDSRSASNEVSADQFSGRIWTADRQDTYDRANRSATIAGVFYGVGGALLLATAITYMVTEPEPEKLTIHPHGPSSARALVAPTRGGAIIGGGWSF